MNLLRERKFLLLAATLGMLFLLQPILNHLETGRFWFEVFRSLIFLALLLTFHGHWGGSRWGFGFGVATLATQWAAWSMSAFHLEVGFHLLAALFVGFAVAATIRSLFLRGSVTSENIFAAVVTYFLVGILFAHLYFAAETALPGSFTAGDTLRSQLAEEGKRFYVLLYFSLSALTTVGFGDITPGTDLMRALAMVEAVAGQFYIAVLIAALVNRMPEQGEKTS